MIDLKFGDCLEVMGEIADASIDLILADLPYGTTACKWDVIIPFEPLWAHYNRLLKPRGAVVLTASQPFTSMLVMSNREWFKYEWVWNKETGTNFQLANYQPLKVHESIVVFSPSAAVYTKCGSSMTFNPQRSPRDPDKLRPYPKALGNMMRIRSGVARRGQHYDEKTCFPVSILTYSARAAECNGAHRMHPTQKPVPLFEYLIKTYSNDGDTVLDNAMGSGTTLVACLNTNRHGIGIESEPVIFATAQCRLAAEQAKTPLFSTG